MKTVVLILASFLNLLIRGMVLVHLLRWFVVPLGVPAIGALQAIGISTNVALMTVDLDATRAHNTALVLVLASFVVSVVSWTFGLILWRMM